jgi:hypothetical protein
MADYSSTEMYPRIKTISLSEIIMEDIPSKDDLLLADALLFAVYGWNPDKVKKMRLLSLNRWIKLSKKRMTWGDAFKLRTLLTPKKVSLWQRILKTNS